MPVEIPKESWSGTVRPVTIGATADDGGTRSKAITVGGMNAMPFLDFDGDYPYAPAVGIEIVDQYPDDWSQLLVDEWGEDVLKDPAKWAKAAEDAGADFIQIQLRLEDDEGNPNTPDHAVEVVKQVLEATSLPLLVYGPGQAELDNELLVPVSDATKGEKIVLGLCEDKNYRTIVASALANDHLVTARAPMDVNLSKQLNILVSDMGLPLERVLMDPTVGALGYGIEYGYSAQERLRLAALQGDAMTQVPMVIGVGYETWKAKESKVGDDVPAEWGDWLERSINWETITALTLIEGGAEMIILRHPESLKRVKSALAELTQ